MHPEGQGRESQNQNPRPSSPNPNGPNQGRTSHSPQDHHHDVDDKRYSAYAEVKSPGSSPSDDEDEDDESSRGSYRSRQSQRHIDHYADEKRHSNTTDHHNTTTHSGHVHFNEKQRASGNSGNAHLPPLPPGAKARVSSTDSHHREDLARASWTTASFTEVPNALDELTQQQHYPPKTTPKEKDNKDHHHVLTLADPAKKTMDASGMDLHSILAKNGQNADSILTKYLRPTMADEGTQAGVPSWDWLMRLEQMLIHFFLMVFESSGDTSKLIMEMMSTEAGTQVEEIFQLLLKAEPDMYKELGHLVTLAEKWLIHWRGDSEERQRALEYVRLYMKGVKDKNYYMLPVQVRLHKLGTFIAGLKVLDKDAPLSLPPVRFVAHKTHSQGMQENQFRVGSPRVKPATHFSQVVANILCDRPCNDPLPKATVYADKFGRNVFKNTLHGDKEFKTYTDKKYGNLYQKRELFAKAYSRIESLEIDGAGDIIGEIPDRSECIENVHCWIPKYTKSYVENLEDEGCEILAQADFDKARKIKECKLGKGNQQFCKALKLGVDKSKKLYDWVRGPDGKVHRRLVGSYTELGTTASLSKIQGGGRNQNAPDGRRLIRKTGKGGYYPKAISDTRLGRKHSHETRKTQNLKHGPKGRFGYMDRLGNSAGKGQDKDKQKNTSMNVYKVDGISLDGSGDSGQEDDTTLRKGKSGEDKGTSKKFGAGGGGPQSKSRNYTVQKGKIESSKFGSNYHGPSNYKGQNKQFAGDSKDGQTNRDMNGRQRNRASSSMDDGNGGYNDGRDRDGGYNGGRDRDGGYNGGRDRDGGYNGGRDRDGGYNGGRGGGDGGYNGGRDRSGGYNDSRDRDMKSTRTGRTGKGSNKDRGFVNIFDKKNRKNQAGRRNKGYKKGRYPMDDDDEWEGEEFAGWSPTDSDYYMDMKDDDNSQLMSVNQCWEKASKVLKKPSKALVIPPPENLMLYLEKKFTRAKWPRGSPIASRNYPNGSVFVAHYHNGSSKVFYPHGGLAVAISGPSPVTSQILVVRDPSDQIFFFDKALLAELNSSGKGIIYGEDGIIKAQYNAIGGFKLDNLEKGRRWHWNQGGQRIILKLNKFMSIRISDQDKVFLNFFGNHRGFLVNVASGHEVSLMSINSKDTKVDPIMQELRNLIRPRTQDDNFDYIRGRFTPRPTLGFVDKAKHFANADFDNSLGCVDYSCGDQFRDDDLLYDTFARKCSCDGNEGRAIIRFMNNFPDCCTSCTINTDNTMQFCN